MNEPSNHHLPPADDAPEAGGELHVLHVLIIGAGFSGVAAGIKLLAQGRRGFVILDKEADVGGTWHSNTYPGAACDVPSHLYCYSFEPNPHWSRMYSSQAEIKAYIEHCVDKYGVRPYIRQGAKVVGLHLQPHTDVWQVRLSDGRTYHARHVINASGGLHLPTTPALPGHERFAGAAMHTAKWDHSVDLTGARVGIIGSAASAIQVVPEVAKVAKHLSVFQRTPNYIAPRNDRDYTQKEKQRFARWPRYARLYRWLIFIRMELLLFPVVKLNSKWGVRLGGKIKEWIRASVQDKSLHSALEPDYALGCKRILISDDFYATLNRDNVTLVTAPIEKIEADAVCTSDGECHPIDVLVYATGYDIEKHMLSIDVVGLNGASLRERWAEFQDAYKGACISDFPNFYMVTGPNTGVGTTSVVYMVEQQLHQILGLIEAAGESQLLGARQQAQADYNRGIHDALGRRVWSSGCKSWYRREDGRIVTLYPFNARTFSKQAKQVVLEDFQHHAFSDAGVSASDQEARQ